MKAILTEADGSSLFSSGFMKPGIDFFSSLYSDNCKSEGKKSILTSSFQNFKMHFQERDFKGKCL